jgi:predicted TIM-barrel fold metal-dependent hydrolase
MRRMTGITQVQDKVMLGSDAAPTVLERFAENLEPLKALNVPEEVMAKLLGGSAARLLKLSRKLNDWATLDRAANHEQAF